MKEKPIEQMGLREIREIARPRMSAEAWEHVMGAAESGTTLRRNQKAFRRFLFRQRIFHDVTNPDTSLELFGRRLSTPALVAPIGSFSKIGERAERHVVEGAGRAGTMVSVSHAAKSNVRDWAEGASGPLVFMGYLSKGREQVLEYARLAELLGYAAEGGPSGPSDCPGCGGGRRSGGRAGDSDTHGGTQKGPDHDRGQRSNTDHRLNIDT